MIYNSLSREDKTGTLDRNLDAETEVEIIGEHYLLVSMSWFLPSVALPTGDLVYLFQPLITKIPLET